jgi:hypothetical protein
LQVANVFRKDHETVAESVMQKIQELSEERERLVHEESRHGIGPEGHARLEEIDHDLRVLWDLRRRELAGEEISLNEDYYDRYDRYTGGDEPGR